MRPINKFREQPRYFWANVRTISQATGYTARGKGTIRVPTRPEIETSYQKLGLSSEHLFNNDDATELGSDLLEYFEVRSKLLHEVAEPNLMDANTAEATFFKLKKQLQPTCPLPMNKQKGDKKAPAFFTGIINMSIRHNCEGIKPDYDPRELTTVTLDGLPFRTMSRRVDGAFPSPVNPIAIWEIKEYYYTTTFGSRVADGIYETLLDGMELGELQDNEKVEVLHYLMVDAYYTWWECGKSYLCRIVDMLHMGYVDEVLFGRKVLERLPILVRHWVKQAKSN